MGVVLSDEHRDVLARPWATRGDPRGHPVTRGVVRAAAPLGCAVMTARWPFIHHVTFIASDLEASTRFYSAALAPLGVVGETADIGAEFWEEEQDTPSFGLYAAGEATVTRGAHIAFTARDRASVDAFHEAALAAGGTSRHEPRLWPEYRAYCAFVDDPDGNNVEAVHKEEEA